MKTIKELEIGHTSSYTGGYEQARKDMKELIDEIELCASQEIFKEKLKARIEG